MSPLKFENKRLYGPNWKQIRCRILGRAGHRCEGEGCGVRNRAWGWRDDSGAFHEVWKGRLVSKGYSKPPFLLFLGAAPYGLRIIEIVLTIAHLDQSVENMDESNLRALCQRCHLAHDRVPNQAKAQVTYAEKRAQIKLL